jgi:hypothetical protein
VHPRIQPGGYRPWLSHTSTNTKLTRAGTRLWLVTRLFRPRQADYPKLANLTFGLSTLNLTHSQLKINPSLATTISSFSHHNPLASFRTVERRLHYLVNPCLTSLSTGSNLFALPATAFTRLKPFNFSNFNTAPTCLNSFTFSGVNVATLLTRLKLPFKRLTLGYLLFKMPRTTRNAAKLEASFMEGILGTASLSSPPATPSESQDSESRSDL